jgi:TonB family protein
MTLLLLNTTIKISVIVSAALAATILLRRQSAAVRHFVLAAALACAAATPIVRVVAPAWQPASRLQVIDRPLAVFDDSESPTPASVVRAPTGGSIDRTAVVRAVSVIWMTGVVLALAVLGIGLARLRFIASHANRVEDGPWAGVAADVARAYGLRRTPLVLHSPYASVLGTWGVAHAKVLLPADALDWPAERIRIVLAHELAHVRRGDWIVQVAVEVLCAAYWFNPLVWLAARRLRLESEQACDDAVLTMGVEGSAYASELVDLARAFRSGRQAFVPAAPIARPSSLERRVRAMLNVKLNRDPITRTASVTAAVVLAAVTVAVAGFGVSAQGQFASVSGSVVDPNNRPISGARLVLSNTAAQTKNEVKSDASGRYEFVGIPSGTYELMFEFPGMAYLKREGLALAGGQTAQVNAVMKIGSVTETITVTRTPGSRPLVSGYSGARQADKPDPCAQSTNGACLRPPVKIKDVRPVFPPGVEGGTVILSARIDTDGFVTDLKVLREVNQVIAAAAVDAVSRWEFLPTHLDGQPIDTNMTVTVNFAN